MTLYVGLIHDVDAKIVEHRHHLCLTRIVTRTNSIDVRHLHHRDVLIHGAYHHRATSNGMCILRVDALEIDALTVDINQLSTLLNVSESVMGREHHLLMSVTILLAHHDGIELRIFSRPQTEAVKRGQLTIENGGLGIGGRGTCDERSVFIQKLHLYRLGGGRFFYCSHRNLDVQRTATIVVGSIKVGSDHVVGNVSLRRRIEIDVTVDAAHVPGILSFQIGAVVIAYHLYGDIVLSSMYLIGKVELCIVVSSL